MAENVKRVIMEEGIVLEKIYQEARKEIKFKDGSVLPASDEKYLLKCVSGEEFTEDDGFKNSIVQKYEVECGLFDVAKYGDKVLVKYEMSNSANNPNKPISVKLL